MLLAKVKSDNAEIAEAEKQLAEMQDGLRKGRAKLAQLKEDAGAANDPKAQKQHELFARDKEMSELIDTFEEKKAVEVKKTADTQAEIVRLLQAMSRKQEYLDNTAGLSAARMQEMKSDLDFKQTQMDNSATTSNRLGLELEKRKVELEKIHTLDQKISSELTQLTEKMETMKAELAGFQVRRRAFVRRMADCGPKFACLRRKWGVGGRLRALQSACAGGGMEWGPSPLGIAPRAWTLHTYPEVREAIRVRPLSPVLASLPIRRKLVRSRARHQ